MATNRKQGRDDRESIEVAEKTKERFDRKKAEMDAADPHLPDMEEDQFMNTLLDTLEAVENGYYSDRGAPQEGRSDG